MSLDLTGSQQPLISLWPHLAKSGDSRKENRRPIPALKKRKRDLVDPASSSKSFEPPTKKRAKEKEATNVITKPSRDTQALKRKATTRSNNPVDSTGGLDRHARSAFSSKASEIHVVAQRASGATSARAHAETVQRALPTPPTSNQTKRFATPSIGHMSTPPVRGTRLTGKDSASFLPTPETVSSSTRFTRILEPVTPLRSHSPLSRGMQNVSHPRPSTPPLSTSSLRHGQVSCTPHRYRLAENLDDPFEIPSQTCIPSSQTLRLDVSPPRVQSSFLMTTKICNGADKTATFKKAAVPVSHLDPNSSPARTEAGSPHRFRRHLYREIVPSSQSQILLTPRSSPPPEDAVTAETLLLRQNPPECNRPSDQTPSFPLTTLPAISPVILRVPNNPPSRSDDCSYRLRSDLVPSSQSQDLLAPMSSPHSRSRTGVSPSDTLLDIERLSEPSSQSQTEAIMGANSEEREPVPGRAERSDVTTGIVMVKRVKPARRNSHTHTRVSNDHTRPTENALVCMSPTKEPVHQKAEPVATSKPSSSIGRFPSSFFSRDALLEGPPLSQYAEEMSTMRLSKSRPRGRDTSYPSRSEGKTLSSSRRPGGVSRVDDSATESESEDDILQFVSNLQHSGPGETGEPDNDHTSKALPHQALCPPVQVESPDFEVATSASVQSSSRFRPPTDTPEHTLDSDDIMRAGAPPSILQSSGNSQTPLRFGMDSENMPTVVRNFLDMFQGDGSYPDDFPESLRC